MTKTRNVPFQFSNELVEGKRVLTLSGNIRKKYWSDDDVIDAKSIRETLDGVTEDITIKLNSPGGDVFEGVEIYNYLKDHPSKVTVEVTGVAASAATFILSAADEAIMNVGTSVMIHEASTFTWGNKQDIQKTLNALETIDDSILSIYSQKTGQTTDQLEIWMKEEKWFTAEEAVEYGFATEVKKNTEKNLTDSKENIAEMVKNAVSEAMSLNQQAVTNEAKQESKPKPKPKPKQKSLINRLTKGA